MSKHLKQQHRTLGLKLLVMTLAMFAFGFALVPLYSVFCEITGIRSEIVATDAGQVLEAPDMNREVTIEFVANRVAGTTWEFQPSVTKMKVHPGKLYSTTFFARNLLDRPVTGLATPDIKPGVANKYFRKTECFCFSPQAFGASEGREMAVRFIVDPEMPDYVDTVTLSYNFYSQAELASAAR
jgi:cytochrome c oxidase assembly protein subunit 11